MCCHRVARIQGSMHEMYVTDWAKTWREGPVLNTVLNWLEAQKKTDLKTLLEQQRGLAGFEESPEFYNSSESPLPTLNTSGGNKDLLFFMVPRAHRATALNGCHQDAGHQGCDQTLSLFQEHFWWLGITSQMWQSIRTCTCCLQHEGSLPKATLHPIMATAPLDILHVDFTSIETTLEPD